MRDRSLPKELEGHGYVYLMLDTINPNVFKFGLSKDPIERVDQLFTTGTPEPLELYQVWSVTDMRRAERVAHDRFRDHRINGRREFFEIVTYDAAVLRNLEVPHTHFGGRGLADVYLQALVELLEDDWDYCDLSFKNVDISDLVDKKNFFDATRGKFDSL